MKISLKDKLNTKDLKKYDALLLPVWYREKGSDVMGEVFATLPETEQSFVKEYLKSKKRAPGKSYSLELRHKPGFIFISIEKSWDRKSFSLLVRKFILTIKKEGLSSGVIYLDDFEKDNLEVEDLVTLASENSLMANFDFSTEFKKEPKEGWPLVKEITLISNNGSKGVKGALNRGVICGEMVNTCRVMCNYPPGLMTPVGMAEMATTVSKDLPIKVSVFDENKLKKQGMNAILAVGGGSVNPPRLIVMEYNGGKESDPKLALVGKGITFDSGGLNIKPGNYMNDMHLDMSGGASVIYALAAIAKLKLPVNVVGVVAAAENLPSGTSYRPRDIIRSYSGKTIEIGNTDAEGRVVLADALGYVETKNPDLIVTIATLTGAVVVALGERISGLFVKDDKELRDRLEEVGEISLDEVWPLPLMKENQNEVEGVFADVNNTHKRAPYAGASAAAAFLSHFVDDKRKFAHIDMASRMISIPEEEFLTQGSVGFGVRYFVELASQWPLK